MSDISADLRRLAEQVLTHCRSCKVMLATAESCTGGLIAASLTAIPGSSDVVDRSFVTYTNRAKNQMIGVPMRLFDEVGAVSHEVAKAMAEGALSQSDAQIAVSVTGVAGPGASEQKPAGLVYIGIASDGAETRVEECRFTGDRDAVRHATVLKALEMVDRVIDTGYRTAIS